MDDSWTCPACGVRYDEHLGLTGTCRELQEATARLKQIETAAAGLATFTGVEAMAAKLHQAQSRIRDLTRERDIFRDQWESLNTVHQSVASDLRARIQQFRDAVSFALDEGNDWLAVQKRLREALEL